MSLQKQPVHLNLTGGLQKKDDQFLVIPSKLAVADDVQFDDASTVVRRGGQASLSLGAYNALAVKRAFTHQGVMVLEQSSQLTRAGAGGLSQVLNPVEVSGHTPPRAGPRAGMTTQRIAGINPKGTAYGAGIPWYDGSYDCASIGNKTCYVFETRSVPLGTQTIRVVLVDDANNFRLYDSTITDSTKVLVKPRIVASASKFFIFFGSFVSGAGTFDIKSITMDTTGTPSSVNSIITGVTGHGGAVEGTADDAIIFDAAITSDFGHLGLVVRLTDILTGHYEINTTDGYTIDASGSTVPSALITSLTALFTTAANADVVLHAFYSIGTNVAKAAEYDITNTTAGLETTVGTAAVGTVVGRIAAYEQSTSLLYLAYDAQSSANSARLRMSSFTPAYASLSECAGVSPWFVAGRISSVNSRLYMPMVFMSDEYQGTFFVIDLTSALGNLGAAGAVGVAPHVVARIDYGESAVTFNRRFYETRVPNMPVRSNSLILPYLKYETDLRIAGPVNDTAYALARAVVDFDSQLQHEEINGLTFLAGACPYIFDGSAYVEEGFHHGPECISVGTPAASGTYEFPSTPTATYSFCFTQAWQDAQGNWHESAPSEEQTVTITAGSGFYQLTPTVVQAPTQKPGARLLFYRTKGSSTDTSMYLAVTSSGASISSDTDLDDGEQLYTAGGVLPNTPAPSCRHVSTFQKRLVLSGCGDGSRVHWSKVTTPGYGVEFSSGDPTHQTVVPVALGRAVGTEELDDRLIILCENGVGLSGGAGPAATGTQGQYSDPATIITEVGCSWDSPKSIIRGPEGVWFRSPFGMRLVSRSGGLGMVGEKQAGSEVDSLVSGTVVAVAGDAKQQIRFYQSSGTVLIWDYQWRQWTRFTGHANVDAVYADDRYYHLSNYATTTPLMRYTDETVYADVSDAGTASTEFTGYIETGWLSFAGIQGFQRVYRLKILGKIRGWTSGQHVITGAFGYDFDVTSPPTTETFTTGNLTPQANGLVQVEHHFAKQKCESLKIGISFKPKAGDLGRLRLTDLTLQVGVKSSYYKTPAGTRY